MNKRIKISHLSLKLIGIVVLSAVVSIVVLWLAFLNRYRVFYAFYTPKSLEQETAQMVEELQSNVTNKKISRKDSKQIQKELRKYKGYTIDLYNSDIDFTGEYITSSLENQAYLQTSSLLVRLYDPLPVETKLIFYDGTYIMEIFSYQGVMFMMRYMLLIILFSIVLFICIIMLYVHRKMRYVVEIGEEMKLIENGDYHHTIVYKGNDEITLLARQLNQLRNALYDNMVKEKDARKANEELVTAMSHDLRTPLTSLLGYLDILNMGIYKSEEEQKKYMSKSKEKAEQIKQMSDRLFNHFLVYAQEDEAECVTINQQEILAMLRRLCEDLKDQHFQVYDVLEIQDFQIRADYKLLERISSNLFSNIKKYADKEMIVVALTIFQGQMIIKIKNRKKKNVDKEESTHIGLKSIQKMMKDMGASVVIEEDRECFSIELIFPCRLHEDVQEICQ